MSDERSSSASGERDHRLAFGPYQFDHRLGILHRDGDTIDLPSRAAGVLEYLLQQPGEVVAKQEIIDAVWSDTAVTENSLTEAIGVLRKALDDDASDPTYIQTVHGRGYRFLPPVSTVDEEDGVTEGLEGRGPPVRRPGRNEGSAHPERWTWKGLGILTAGIAAGVLLAILGSRLLQNGAGRRASRAVPHQITLPLPDARRNWLASPLAISPSGDVIAWSSNGDSGTRLRHLATGESVQIPLSNVFFSPDGNRVAGFAPRGHARMSLSTVPTGGGPPEIIAHLGSRQPEAGAWGADGSIVIDFRMMGLHRLATPGGELEPLTTLDDDSGETDHRWPRILPDGRVLFTVFAEGTSDSSQRRRVAVIDPRTGERTTVLENGGLARYVHTGHLVFSRGGQLFAVPFDLDRLQIEGAPVPVEPEVRTCPHCEQSPYDVSSTGTLVYMTGTVPQHHNVVQVRSRQGAVIRTLQLPRGFYRAPSLSPAEATLALTVEDVSGTDLILYDLDRDTHSRFPLPGEDGAPVWTPDGEWIVYSSRGTSGQWGVYRLRADGSSGSERVLVDPSRSYFPWSVSPDGNLLALSSPDPETGLDIYILPLDRESEETGEPRPYLRTPYRESGPRFTPDGRWIVYHSNETGRFQIYARPYPGPGPRVRLSTASGGWPRLARGSRELFHRTNPPLEDHVAAVSLRWTDQPEPIDEQLLFEHDGGGRVLPEANSYAVSDDGSTFYIPTSSEVPRSALLNDELHLIVNWFVEVERATASNP